MVRGLYQASEGRVCRSEPPAQGSRYFLSKTLFAQIREAEAEIIKIIHDENIEKPELAPVAP